MAKQHALLTVRRATGLPRKTFADLLGKSPSAIKRIENGSLPLSEGLAKLIYFATGADYQKLLKGKAVDSLTGEPYDNVTFFKWKEWTRESRESTESVKQLVTWIELLLDAAAAEGKLDQVWSSLTDWANAARKDFGLASIIDAELKTRKIREVKSMSVGLLRKNPQLAQVYNFKPSPNQYDEDVVKVEKFYSMLWYPEGQAAVPPKQPSKK